ncbi:hypothetical protein [Pseudoxanthomonas sp.]|uniref:hypothetical protein n=1 Tax=Pseudoxanthomonas sp. TaxID=1871049 RepID=UPI002E15AABD|nr:hypothetical protein [Pseudoxanthomonas sp.]
MEWSVVQRTSIRLTLEEDRLWATHEYHPAERFQPWVGALFLSAVLVWSQQADTGTALSILVGLMVAWALFLLLRYPASRARRLWALLRPRIGKDQVSKYRFHEYGCSWQYDESMCFHYRWTELREVVHSGSGLGLVFQESRDGERPAYLFVSKRSMSHPSDYDALLDMVLDRMVSKSHMEPV